MSRGDAAHAAKHTHGVGFRNDPPAPQTVEQRVAKLEQGVPAPTGFHERITALEARITTLETRVAELVAERDERVASAKVKKAKD